ncbi:hypothetical protein N0O92_00440 [Alkalihalobacillus sp. MEB130]|uniref:hypothetical protein n=1 Tax=Alkalihalobacillus sp. MEB130 TaxID=2976704 RepID=UPI0028DEC8CB|nr:hypothetical protein [Alkalihalobacillus sp. MEB130]MDT8858676.1 hypothetical protein [Alkalihalobacillus sp. MEB130]
MFYYHYRNLYPYYYRQQDSPFPPVDISFFQKSLVTYQTLLEHGQTIINHFVSSREKMTQLMDAAQASDDAEVDRLIRETGVPTVVETSYSPTGVTFTLRGDVGDAQCCTLTMYLRWGF